MSDVTQGCAAVLDDLAAIVNGDREVLQKHADHLAVCDSCRDLRYEATEAATLVKDAGDDYVSPDDIERRVLGALDTRGAAPSAAPDFALPKAQAPSVSGTSPVSPATPMPSSVGRPSERRGANPSVGGQPASSQASRKTGSGVGGKVVWLFAAVAAAALIGAVVIGKLAMGGGETPVANQPVTPGAGVGNARIAEIVRAAADGQTGVSIRAPGSTDFAPATADSVIVPGATIRTDERTRARLTLADGSSVTLNHRTELMIDPTAPRRATLTTGEIVADITHLEQGPMAVFTTPTGTVEVLGTRFALSATEDMASVRVSRGAVRVRGATSGTANVKAGQEGLMGKASGVTVTPMVDIAGSIAWSELGTAAADAADEAIPGLGELRARRPGERSERERPLSLSNHKVTVRIVGNVARTEIEEVFQNDSSDTLEGIYRFPLPPDASIAKLALDVEGRMEQGAFVDRDRAARIWRGVIRHQTAVQDRIKEEDYVWVPGPWSDPALLEWQRGGRFELRIFPIAAHGSRRIQIAYTQVIAPHGNGRRYVYPLPHSGNASTRVGRFEVDARVTGAATVSAPNYNVTSSNDSGATRLQYVSDGFVPSGDLIVDYSSPDANAELRSWTFNGGVAVAPPESSREQSPDVHAAQQALAADPRAFVAFSIRPELPPWTDTRDRDYVVVVDSSQSMTGERFTRAARLASVMVGELDRRDRFVVMACDVRCRSMAEDPRTPSSQASNEVASWLASVRPAGASDVVGSLRAASRVLEGKTGPDRDVRVIYIGDGVASVGHRRAADISAEVASLTQAPRRTFTSVGIGGDADTVALSAIARSGGGHYIPYVPGEHATRVAQGILETTYGVSLSNATLVLPAGITDVAPAHLPTIRAGEEVIVTGRFTGAVNGEVVISGTVGGQAYVDRYPVQLTASTAAGNAFVPSLWAAKSIEDLDISSAPDARTKIVALSKAFNVMSRHTSLLVLESEAMFQAFGVDRARTAVQWTGEDAMETGEANGSVEQAQGTEISSALGGLGSIAGGTLGLRGGGAGGGGSGAGFGRAARMSANRGDMDDMAAPAEAERSEAMPDTRMRRGPAPATATAPAPAAQAPAREMQMPAGGAASAADSASMQMPQQPTARPMPRSNGRWMRRVWFRVGDVQSQTSPTASEARSVAVAESALAAAPDSRDKHRALVRAASRAGNVARAREVAEKWLGRDQLDPEALTFLSDAIGRDGRRDDSLRVLSGIVDLRPDDRALQDRMARAYDRAGMADLACAHRIAIADIAHSDGAALGAAMRCERALGQAQSATRLIGSVSDETARRRAEEVAAQPTTLESVSGDIVLDAAWGSATDLDLAIITPQGTRLSWMGGRSTVTASDAGAAGREKLALRRAGTGNYILEIARTRHDDQAPVSGRVTVSVMGTRRVIPFTLTGERTVIGRANITRESRMESVGGSVW